MSAEAQKPAGMSTGAKVLAGTAIAGGATAAALMAFGNVGATAGNLQVGGWLVYMFVSLYCCLCLYSINCEWTIIAMITRLNC